MTETKSYSTRKSSDNFIEIKYVPTEIGKLKADNVSNKSDTLFLYFTIITGTLPILTGAAAFAWTSPVIPKLQSNDTSINPLSNPVTTLEISLIASLPYLASPIGALLSAPLSEKIGRKKFLQFAAAGMLLFNSLMAFSYTPTYIIITRWLFYLFSGGYQTITPVYVTEVSEDHNRAKFGCILGWLLPAGTLLAFVFGPPFSVRNFTFIISIPVVIFLILMPFVPESPIFSLFKGNELECKNSLRKLRSNKTEKELEIDLKKISETLENKQKHVKIGIVSVLKIREARIGLLLVLIPDFLLHGCGAPVLTQFLAPVFNKTISFISGNNIAIMIGLTKTILFFFSFFVVEKTGRKPLLIYSSLGCCIPLILLGWFFYLKRNESPLVDQLNLFAVVSFFIYIISYSMGVGPVPPSLSGEMFTTELRAAASSIIKSILAVVAFLCSFAFPIVAEYIGYHLCFWMFAVFCLIGAFLIHMMLPETRGRSLNEIQDILKNYKFDLKRKV